MLKILFIGDVNGRIGRETLKKVLPGLKAELKPDLTIANAENVAHGKGLTESTIKELMEIGIDWFTSGDHAFDKEKQLDLFEKSLPVLRPANYSSKAKGRGHALINVGKHQILLVNLIGRVFMKMDHDCPFAKIEEILADKELSEKNPSAIIIDMHAEATSEKEAMKHFLDGKASAVLGTHTHVMTADAQITEEGTAFISDVGMVGYRDGILGVEKENIIKTFKEQIKYTHVIPESGRTILNAVLIKIDNKNGKAVAIKPIIKYTEIK